jgi:chromosome partitioning protein
MQQINYRAAIKTVSLNDITEQSKRIKHVMGQIKEAMLAPENSKKSPMFNSAGLCDLCSISKVQLNNRLTKGDLPLGKMKGSRREWTLPEVLEWVKAFKPLLRPTGASAVTIAVANFKGGVTKTTTAVTLAQGLSLKGLKVLIIDLDPQASATSLFGYLPNTEIDRNKTALDVLEGAEELIDGAIQQTYWTGIDIVASAPMLFSADFALPSRQKDEKNFEFWTALDLSLSKARNDYDVIIIDTAPALSYVTINALIAADGIIMPLPPNTIDFASSSQFWDLFSDLMNELYRDSEYPKEYEFIKILLSKVKSDPNNTTAMPIVKEWILEAYADKVLPVEIPETVVTTNASAKFGTIFDVDKTNLTAKTYTRAKEKYDDFVNHINDLIQSIWSKQMQMLKEEMEKV